MPDFPDSLLLIDEASDASRIADPKMVASIAKHVGDNHPVVAVVEDSPDDEQHVIRIEEKTGGVIGYLSDTTVARIVIALEDAT